MLPGVPLTLSIGKLITGRLPVQAAAQDLMLCLAVLSLQPPLIGNISLVFLCLSQPWCFKECTTYTLFQKTLLKQRAGLKENLRRISFVRIIHSYWKTEKALQMTGTNKNDQSKILKLYNKKMQGFYFCLLCLLLNIQIKVTSWNINIKIWVSMSLWRKKCIF